MKKLLLCGLAMGMMMAVAVSCQATTFTTNDGVLSIDVPDSNEFLSSSWTVTTDPNYWFAISDGASTITVDHLSNGENLPAVQVANQNYSAVYQAFVSTQNEVFVVKAMASSASDLPELMEIVGTIKVLRYDTKKAINSNKVTVSEFALRAIGAVYYVNVDKLNVRSTCSTDGTKLGSLGYGEEVMVNGMVTRNGEDYGWYQINYNGSNAYVASEFLSNSKPAAGVAAGESKVADTPAGQTRATSTGRVVPVTDAKGYSMGNLTLYSDGYYYSNDGVAFRDNGNGSFTQVGGETMRYSLDYLDWLDDDIIVDDDAIVIDDPFPVTDAKGYGRGYLTPYNDGYYRSEGMGLFVSRGDGSYINPSTGYILYDFTYPDRLKGGYYDDEIIDDRYDNDDIIDDRHGSYPNDDDIIDDRYDNEDIIDDRYGSYPNDDDIIDDRYDNDDDIIDDRYGYDDDDIIDDRYDDLVYDYDDDAIIYE